MKINTPLLFIVLSLASSLAGAESAYRDLKTDYSIYEERFVREHPVEDEKLSGKSALRSAVKYTNSFSTEANTWASLESLQERFEKIRDERSLVWKSKPTVMRRASWFYPDDGCWTRAAIAVRTAFQAFYPLPNKIYVFGNLRVKTKNSPRGVVGWWYHVAPIVKVGTENFVIDPAIEWSRPLPIKVWLSRMGKPEKMKVAICSSGTYSPGDSCGKMTNGLEIRAESVQQSYLELEWKRMVSLGRESDLGKIDN